MNRVETLDPKALEIAQDAAEVAYLAEEHEGLAFDGAVKAGIVSYLGSLSTPIAAGSGEAGQLRREKNELVLAAYPALDAIDAIRAWCDEQEAVTATDILREWFGGDRYARDHEYLDANYGKQARQVANYLALRAALSPGRIGEETEEASRDILEGLMAEVDLLRLAVVAKDPTAELRIRVDDIRKCVEALRASLSRKTTGEAEPKPFMFGVRDKATGEAVFDEHCVAAEPEHLVDDWDADYFEVVPLFASEEKGL
ncbi:hypothetical protein LB559_09035 [Mesorhizobium sp. BR1-1-3]|uniref:hypothetical protein n=1 Tax=Mesorhizobium sp. BR1-1-3 TaxID=2876651 RepID=UPI001CD05A9C|nr:hypothetical protein [Mesorhizobium sp. BR1-1-3]MBZ9888082.1 hypothetical protein [Mesorhizobium sp. BR1-1-3]